MRLSKSYITEKVGRAVLFSTDTSLDPLAIVAYYKARCKAAIHTHINASLSALKLLKLEDRRHKKTSGESAISIASWRRKKFNQNLMAILFQRLGLSRDCDKVAQAYEVLSDYGAIAA